MTRILGIIAAIAALALGAVPSVVVSPSAAGTAAPKIAHVAMAAHASMFGMAEVTRHDTTPDNTGKARAHEGSGLDSPLCKMHCLGHAVAPLRAQPNENGLSLPFELRVIEDWQHPSRPGAPPQRPPKNLI